MRARAVSSKAASVSSWHHPALAAAAIVIGTSLWYARHWMNERDAAATASRQHIEQLTAAIDEHLDARSTLSDWEFPTDILLTSVNP